MKSNANPLKKLKRALQMGTPVNKKELTSLQSLNNQSEYI